MLRTFYFSTTENKTLFKENKKINEKINSKHKNTETRF